MDDFRKSLLLTGAFAHITNNIRLRATAFANQENATRLDHFNDLLHCNHPLSWQQPTPRENRDAIPERLQTFRKGNAQDP
jgi:hypothetical protein